MIEGDDAETLVGREPAGSQRARTALERLLELERASLADAAD